MSADERKRLRQALSGYKQLLASEPENLEYLEQLARLSLALGEGRRASGFLVTRAEVLARRGEVDVALADCRSALAITPGHPEADRLRQTFERLLVAAPALTSRTRDIMAFRSPRPDLPEDVRARTTLPLSPIRRPVDQILADLPGGEVVEASALLAIHEVDGVDVVPLLTDMPEELEPAELDELTTDVLDRRRIFQHIQGGPATLQVADSSSVFDLDDDDWEVPEASDDGDTVDTDRPLALPEPVRAAVMPPPPPPSLGDPEDSLEVELDQVEAMLRLASAGPQAAESGPPPPPLPEADLFRVLPQAVRDDLARRATRALLRVGAVVAREGDLAPDLIVVAAGRVRVERTEGDALLLLGPGELVGAEERVYGGAVRAQAVAETAVEVVRLEPGVVEALRRRFPEFGRLLRQAAAQRHGAWLLGANPMFQALGPAERAFVSEHLQHQRLKADAVLCEAGDALDALVLVAGGVLEVTREGKPVATLRPGRLAGLAAQAHAGRATARIAAGSKGALLYTLDRAAIQDLRRLPAIRDLLDAAVAQRA